jgi:hypothetical protein
MSHFLINTWLCTAGVGEEIFCPRLQVNEKKSNGVMSLAWLVGFLDNSFDHSSL